MAPAGKNLSAVLLLAFLLLVAIADGESASVRDYACNNHLSGSYKGVCIGLINDDACYHACISESSDNYSGACDFFQCWCQGRCNSETIPAAANAPIPA